MGDSGFPRDACPKHLLRYNSRHGGIRIHTGTDAGQVPIFSGLAENELSFLAQRALPRRYLAGELKQENGDENFVERIRIAIQQKLTGRRPNVEDIADALDISSRTLQRRLQDQGSSFQRVLEEARHQLARHYLNNSVLELNEAAYLLGYQDGNSFVRAFRNWEGVPPSRWREQKGSIVTGPNL